MSAVISERHRRAALIRWSREDPREHGEKIRRALHERFLTQADPDGELDDLERERRARKLLEAHMSMMRSAKKARASW
jgi:hypothetical protein